MAQSNISKESELQSLLADERERCSQHKQLYQTLKEEHGKLKDELTLVHQQLKEAVSKNEQIQISKDSYIKRLEEQLREKQKEISRLLDEAKAYDPKKIRDSVLEEATNHYEIKIKELHAEADRVREQYVTLHYEHAVLKCKLESRESEYSHAVERLKVQHMSEVDQLQNKIESLEKENSFPDDSCAMELKSAKHDILQLNAKLKGLLSECEELRAQNENLTLQLSSTNRTQLKQFNDNMSNLRALESEKQKAVMQKEVLEKELSNFQEQRRIMNNDLQSSRREILSLKSKLEECEHKCQMMTTNLQVENEQLKMEYQSEREQMIDEISKLKSELREVAMELDRTQQVLMSKEQELQQNAMIARQQFWKQSNEFQQEREKMEKRFQDYKNQKDQFISQLNHEVQILQQNLQMCSESKLELEKEFISTKEKLEEASKNTDAAAVATLTKQNLNYEKEIENLREHIDRLKSTSNVFLEEKDRLLNDIMSKKKVDQFHEEENQLLQMKLTWEQQKYQFHQRLEELESQLKETKNSSANERKELEIKIQRYSRAVNKLKEKLEFLKLKNEELESQKETLEKNVPFEVHLQVRNKLTELQRRLEEYRLIVAAEPHFSASTRTVAPVSDKLLTDIKNLQLRLPSSGDAIQEYETLRYGREKIPDKTHSLQSKWSTHPRRRSLKTRNREQISKTVSPVITSSSDLELENL